MYKTRSYVFVEGVEGGSCGAKTASITPSSKPPSRSPASLGHLHALTWGYIQLHAHQINIQTYLFLMIPFSTGHLPASYQLPAPDIPPSQSHPSIPPYEVAS